ncbi:MAG: DUF2931 family protein [Capnocytophaga sp.]|nr:DUF2931 family protein [Capnocytophaga sp.]
MKKIFLLLIVFTMQLSSCQNKKSDMKNDKFEWQEATSATIACPIDVYMGGLISKNGFTSLYSGTTAGNWGEANRGMSSGLKTIPNHLHAIWMSYTEHTFYEIDTPIDYDKMVTLFNEGFYRPSDGDDPRPRKEEYDTIIVGFAPGGVVVIWLEGAGRQIEVGRYQGEKKTFSEEEIDALPSGPQKNMHRLDYQRKVVYEWDFIPAEVLKANEGKPIPYGIWDMYRKKYNWQLIFESVNPMKTRKVMYTLFNGEREHLFGDTEIETYPDIPEAFRWTAKIERAIPKTISFRWIENDTKFGGVVKFDEQEVFNVFDQVFENNPLTEAKLVIYINEDKTDATVVLKSEDKEVALFNSKISISNHGK